MSAIRGLFTSLALLFVVACSGVLDLARAGEIRGTVKSVEANGELNIDLPAGAVVRPGDEVRIEADAPGIGPVEIKSRWRVDLVGENFLIAVPTAQTGGKPQIGHTAIIKTAAPAPHAPSKQKTATVPAPGDGEQLSAPALKLTKQQLTALKTRADSGDVEAMTMLGMYHGGKADSEDSVSRSVDEAMRWYETAAKTGDAKAMTSLGFLHLNQREDDVRAAKWFQKGASRGDVAAMSMLAGLLADGRGVAKDDAKSFGWVKKAAEAGDDWAVYELANMYFDGRGTRQDFIEAAHWYRMAADKGNVMAMNKMARIHINGLGLTQDLKRGFEWALKAAEKGSPIAMYQTGTLYLQGVGVAKDPAKARSWYEKSANAGEAESMFALSYLYDKGQGVAVNPGMAADWMILAIRAKSFQAAESVMQTPSKWSAEFRKEFQKRLSEAGFYQGAIDGNIGSGSRRAIAELVKAAP